MVVIKTMSCIYHNIIMVLAKWIFMTCTLTSSCGINHHLERIKTQILVSVPLSYSLFRFVKEYISPVIFFDKDRNKSCLISGSSRVQAMHMPIIPIRSSTPCTCQFFPSRSSKSQLDILYCLLPLTVRYTSSALALTPSSKTYPRALLFSLQVSSFWNCWD